MATKRKTIDPYAAQWTAERVQGVAALLVEARRSRGTVAFRLWELRKEDEGAIKGAGLDFSAGDWAAGAAKALGLSAGYVSNLLSVATRANKSLPAGKVLTVDNVIAQIQRDDDAARAKSVAKRAARASGEEPAAAPNATEYAMKATAEQAQIFLASFVAAFAEGHDMTLDEAGKALGVTIKASPSVVAALSARKAA